MQRALGFRVGLLAACVVLAPLLCSRAAAQEALEYEGETEAEGTGHPPLRDGRARTLAKHVFIPSELVSDPFSATFVRVRTAGGYATTTGPGISLTTGEFVGNADYNQASLNQGVELQIAPARWIALRAGGTAIAYAGVDATSVLAIGATVELGVSAGLTLTLPGTKSFRPGIVFDIQHGPAYDLSFLQPLRTALREQRIVRSAVVDSGDTTRLWPGVSAAFALTRALGLVLAAHYIANSGDDVGLFGQNNDDFSLAGTVDFDLKAFTPIPMGFTGAFRFIHPWEGDDDPVKEGNLGVYYTGRSDLVLGVTGGFRDFPQTRFFSTTAVMGEFTMRYYW
jgi:hypothetical protein